VGIALPAVFYTQHRVHQASKDSSQLVQEHRDLGWVLNSLQDSLRVVESAIYQYPVLLDERSADSVTASLTEAKLQSQELQEHYVVGRHRQFSDFAVNLRHVLDELSNEIPLLFRGFSDAEVHYPATPILLNALHPTNLTFMEAIDLAISKVDGQSVDVRWHKVMPILEELRHTWTQQIDSVRLFIANSAGEDGPSGLSMAQSKSDLELYAQRIDDLLVQLSELNDAGKLDSQQSQSLKMMRAAKLRYDEYFQRAETIYTSKDWRVDMLILRDEIRPSLDQVWGILELMQEELDELAQQNVLKTLGTADTLSNIIWLFMGFMALLVLISYLLFEYLIRRPLLEVSKALDAAGRGENYLPVLRSPTTETSLLVDAFRRMQGQVHSRQVRLESILDNAAEGIITFDENGLVETFNNAAQKLFDCDVQQALGRSVMDLVHFVEDAPYSDFLALCRAPVVEQGGHETTVSVLRRDGSNFPLAIKVNNLEVEGRLLYIAIVEDIGERMAMMEHLRELAEHDSLTGLYNRQYFDSELDRVVENIKRGSRRECGLLYIDLDNFKFVNDTLGHAAGDLVLVEVTRMLSRRNRKSDLLVRLGGDEFAILIYDAEKEQVLKAAEAHRKLLADYTFKHEGKVVQIGCSIGVTLFGRQQISKETLLVQADIACHIAKRSGRNCVHVYESDDKKNMTAMSEDMGWARRIKDAIDQNRFCLACQPIMELKTGEVFRQEVLLRMRDEAGNIVLPAGFLPSAERFGLMRFIDHWVVDHAIAYLGRQLRHNPRLHFSINLSAESIGEPTMLETITNALLQNEVSPTVVTFEITETVAIANLNSAIKFLNQLRNLGCQTALDDFGVGYSSFAYLKDLPVDYVKIDGSFVRDIHRDNLQRAMVRSINDIAHAMGKYTIAEFVDNKDGMQILCEMEVDFIQGYHVGRPRLLEDDAPFVARSNVVRLM
jgi:diguanylate cyclase (GGDEF)-like protein/PAS domain S-box-containing protein